VKNRPTLSQTLFCKQLINFFAERNHPNLCPVYNFQLPIINHCTLDKNSPSLATLFYETDSNELFQNYWSFWTARGAITNFSRKSAKKIFYLAYFSPSFDFKMTFLTNFTRKINSHSSSSLRKYILSNCYYICSSFCPEMVVLQKGCSIIFCALLFN
jgi:hypothetical protein